MAVFEYFHNMCDVRLKPRLLRSLIKEHLPEEKHPFPSPSELANVVSAIKVHGLLSESFGEPVDQELVDKWKSTVDAWVERLLLLVSSKMPDKSWAGICLMGVTCQECNTDRFLASYSAWFQKLLSQIQPPSDSHFVKVASCASLSDLFTRLSGFSNVKKDGTSHAGKLIQPVLKLLTEDGSEALWEGAVDLLCTLINFFPSSVHRHYDNAEAVIVSKIMSGKCNANMLKKFAHFLALLPKARGDEDSWSLMMQKTLISINVHLSDAFQGFEEEIKRSEAMRLLVPPGKDPPPPLGSRLSGEASDQLESRSEKLLLSRVSTLMLCCCTMLTNPYPAQVTVPVRPLLALVKRVLLVDGSLSQTSMPFMTVMQQELICSELPVMHLYSLDLLTAIIKGIRSQLLPHAADVVRLLTEYFRRCALPVVRIKVYSIMQILLISMGVGMALYLAQEVINNAFVDLDSIRGYGIGVASSNTRSTATTYALQRHGSKKRKHVSVAGSPGEHHNGVGLEAEVPKNKPVTPISVQIAALQALEALLTVGGALRSECWRSNVDLLLITVATKACDGGWANEEKNPSILPSELTSTWAEFQLAALRALLASLLSPARVRPPYLSQGLELFRRGKQEVGTKLAEFCAHALLALEVLIHPRALPLADFPSNNQSTFDEGSNRRFPENVFSGSQKHNTLFSRSILGMDDPEPDDDLYDSWLGNGEEAEAPFSNTDKKMESADKDPSEKYVQQAIGDPQAENLPVDGSVGTHVAEEGIREPIGSVNEKTVGCREESMVESERFQITLPNVDVGTSDKGVMAPTGSLGDSEMEFAKGAADSGTLDCSKGGNEMSQSDREGVVALGDASALGEGVILTEKSVSAKGKEHTSVSDSDIDSFPDIIEGDPDSDSD